MPVSYESFLPNVVAAMTQATQNFLEEASGELEAQVKSNTRVDTGQLKGSWRHILDLQNGEAYVGSDLENAIWEELGTGIYALGGNGRKTPWAWVGTTSKWKGRHWTWGKRPNRALWNAYLALKDPIQSRAVEIFSQLGG